MEEQFALHTETVALFISGASPPALLHPVLAGSPARPTPTVCPASWRAGAQRRPIAEPLLLQYPRATMHRTRVHSPADPFHTSNVANVPLYRSHGFHVVRTVHVGDGSSAVPVPLMRRDPKTSSKL